MIAEQFKLVQAQAATDKSAIKVLKECTDLHAELKSFMATSKFKDDDLILFNWWTGTAFNVSINELKVFTNAA